MIGQLNINLIINKSDQIWDILQNDLETLMTSQMKIDNTLPELRFNKKGYSKHF